MEVEFKAKCKVFEDCAEFVIGAYPTEEEAQKAINNFRYKYEMPANNWFIVSFWIDAITRINIESKEIGEYEYEC